MGTEQQLVTFFDRYANHQGLSDKCALDGRYFFKVLAPYGGLVDSELFLRINQGPATIDCNGKLHRSFEALDVAFDVNDLARTKDSPARYRLMKLIIDIGNDPSENTGGVHTNLVYADTQTKQIVRFEPMYDEYYSEKINDILKRYFAKLLPDYSYEMLNEHPQLPTTESCPSKGMCAAYVLKKAMMLVTGNDRPLDRDPKEEELKIMQFADAVETEYGLLPDDDEPEHGLTIGFTPRPYVMPWGPAALYGPRSIPYPYGPEYYGFLFGPRFARRPGFGFCRHRHRWGSLVRQETGVWSDVKNRLETNYEKAKNRMKQGIRARKSRRENKYRSEKFRQKAELYNGEYGDTHTHVHYHNDECNCQGCQQAPPRNQPGYYSPSPSNIGSPRGLVTAMAASPQWNPVPPSRISIGRSPSGGATLQQEVVSEGQYLDPRTGSVVNYTQRTTTPVNSPSSPLIPVGGEFGCGCNGPEKKTTGPPMRREENGRVLNTIGGAVLGTLVAGPGFGTVAGGAAGYALSKPNNP